MESKRNAHTYYKPSFIYPSWYNDFFFPQNAYIAKTQIKKYVELMFKMFQTQASKHGIVLNDTSKAKFNKSPKQVLDTDKHFEPIQIETSNEEHFDTSRANLENLIGVEINADSFKAAISMIHECIEEQDK